MKRPTAIALLAVFLLAGCRSPEERAAFERRIEHHRSLPGTDIETITTREDGFAELRINGVRCIHFQRGDGVGGGGGVSCDWTEEDS